VKPALVFPNQLDFDADACRDYLEGLMRRVRQQGKLPVITHERLSGNPSSGGFDSKQIAERLAAVFPEARILIVIREQKAMLVSAYKDYVDRGGTRSYADYLHSDKGRTGSPGFELSHWAYHRLIAEYLRLFGRDRVLVLPYELFQEEPLAFVGDIAAFAGLDPPPGALEALPFPSLANPSLSALGALLLRPFNALLVDDREIGVPAALLPPGALGRRLARRTERLAQRLPRSLARVVPSAVSNLLERRLESFVANAVAGFYGESNSRTQGWVGVDLRARGYEFA
jgi:hypothetical protein